MDKLVLRPDQHLPDITTATLPASYERACTALAVCQRIDECREWADKAAALASYAKQAEDKTLRNYAVRIQSRAVRRCGELLDDFDGRGNHRKTEGDHSSSKRDVAGAAGISEHQQTQAVRVARIPIAEFEQAVESDDPPTVTDLAERGTTPSGRAVPEEFAAATRLLAIARELRLFAEKHDNAELVADALARHEAGAIRASVTAVGPWARRLLRRLQEKYPC